MMFFPRHWASFIFGCHLWVVLALFSSPVHGNTFIWDPNSPGSIDTTWRRPYSAFSNPPVCVPIPANLTLCYGIKYSEMRIPNLLHHDSLNEVIEQSASWTSLINLKCHPETQLFLCSLFTPICLDQTIPPCRSLCEDVQKSCEPHMRKHGYTWPNIMRCDYFPLDNNMCIQSQSGSPSNTPPLSRPPKPSQPQPKPLPGGNFVPGSGRDQAKVNQTASAASPEDEKLFRRLLDFICKSDWVIKSGAINVRASQLRVKKYKVIYGNLNSTLPLNVAVNETMSNAIADSGLAGLALATSKRKQKFVIVGVGNGRETRFTARTVLNWHSATAQIKRALKKAKSGDVCTRRNRSTATAATAAGRPGRRQKSRNRTRGTRGTSAAAGA